MWQNIRCSILFHLLVPGGKWHTDIFSPVASAMRCSATFHSRARELLLPPPSAVNQQLCGFGISLATHALPPASYRLHGKLRGVVIDPNVDPTSVCLQVVHAVRNCLAQFVVLEVVHAYLRWLALRMLLSPCVLEVTYKLLFLGVYRNDRLAAPLELPNALGNVLELSIAVRMCGPLTGLAVSLQAVASLL